MLLRLQYFASIIRGIRIINDLSIFLDIGLE